MTTDNNGGTPFSTNPVWQLQQQYFEDNGIDAWRTGQVPHYVSSNRFVALRYAEIIFGLLCDTAGHIPQGQKLYILELGAGHGRFCYHILKELDRLIEAFAKPLPQYSYILSDFSTSVTHYFYEHPRLKPYYLQGKLDDCIYNVLEPGNLLLRVSGRTITAQTLATPLVVIANYLFDTIPQELFLKREGSLYLPLTQLNVSPDTAAASVSEQIEGLFVKEVAQQEVSLPYYNEPWLDNTLTEQLSLVQTNTYLLFPAAGLRCLHHLRSLSTIGCIVLTGDRGMHRTEELADRGFPKLNVHGSFSLPVNYHSFKTYCIQQHGKAFFPTHRHGGMVFASLLLHSDAETLSQTTLASMRLTQDFNPDDFYSVKQFFMARAGEASLREILSALRLSNYDAHFFYQLVPELQQAIAGINETDQWDVCQALHKIWEGYFPLGEEEDVAFSIALLLLKMAFYGEALRYFQLSEQLYEAAPNRTYNMALCYYYQGNLTEAITLSERVFAEDPQHELNTHFLKVIRGSV